MKKNMVNVDSRYIREQVSRCGLKYAQLAQILGRASEGSLTGALSIGRISLDELKKLARVADFPYEEAIRQASPKAYIKNHGLNVTGKMDEIIKMQMEINLSIISLIKEIERNNHASKN